MSQRPTTSATTTSQQRPQRPKVRLRTGLTSPSTITRFAQPTPIQPSPLLSLRRSVARKPKKTRSRFSVSSPATASHKPSARSLLIHFLGRKRILLFCALVVCFVILGIRLEVFPDFVSAWGGLAKVATWGEAVRQGAAFYGRVSYWRWDQVPIWPLPLYPASFDDASLRTKLDTTFRKVASTFQQPDPLYHPDADPFAPPKPSAPVDHSKWDDEHKTWIGRLAPHDYAPNGLVMVNEAGMHPIYDLVARAEANWKKKLKRASKTFEEAVKEYQRRYGRDPPRGFDKWWLYVEQHSIRLPDEYDQIHNDLQPFWGVEPSYIRHQQALRENDPNTFTLACVNGRVFLANAEQLPTSAAQNRLARQRIDAQLEILQPIEAFLPDFRATFSTDDVPNEVVSWEVMNKATAVAKLGKNRTAFLDPEAVQPDHTVHGWASACPPSSPIHTQNPNTPINLASLAAQTPKSFVYNHVESMNPCSHPSLVHLNGFLQGYDAGPTPSPNLRPSFAHSKTTLHADILTVPNERWTEDVGFDPDWEDKLRDKLAWRGTNTGIYFSDRLHWRWSQRVRFIGAFGSDMGSEYEYGERVDVLRNSWSAKIPVGRPRTGVERRLLNRYLMDVAFVREPLQCEPSVCAYVKKHFRYAGVWAEDEVNDYKFVFDIDGNGWSARFKRLITSKSLILKSTIFPEWYSARIQPWYHYIPIKPDLSDLYDVMTFFRGDIVDSTHDVEDDEWGGETAGHDQMAKSIAAQGSEWSRTFWRKQDMVAYMFRLFLEYGRVWSDERDDMGYNSTAHGIKLGPTPREG
ncbi:Glycosyltransferase Family 90 domain containing protein [Tulasnella sp. 403]|nr:Glycosyltransferase Family 90 domain containing protein [Tulasnella sp. 403]